MLYINKCFYLFACYLGSLWLFMALFARVRNPVGSLASLYWLVLVLAAISRKFDILFSIVNATFKLFCNRGGMVSAPVLKTVSRNCVRYNILARYGQGMAGRRDQLKGAYRVSSSAQVFRIIHTRSVHADSCGVDYCALVEASLPVQDL